MYIVVGASRGIGFALVSRLLQDGKSVIALSRNVGSLDALSAKGKLIIRSLDVSDEGQIAKFFREAIEWSKVKGVIYCAGALLNKAFTELSLKDWQSIYKVNVFGPAQFTRSLIEKVGVEAEVRHLYIGSMGGFQGSAKFAGLSAYSSSKAALACMSECLAEEFKDGAHTFNTLSIGAVQTEMLEEAFPGYVAPVSPEEMAGFISELLELSKMMFNGKNIPVSLSTP